MGYIGIQTQQSRNNIKSIMMLIAFPLLVFILVYAFIFILNKANNIEEHYNIFQYSFYTLLNVAPYILLFVGVWFTIAYFANTSIISNATHSVPLERKDNKRIYNLVENLSMSQGMKMPKINVIEDNSLNAFASGINDRTYTVTLTRGIINKLDDSELEGVIAHELMHIKNRDVRLLIVSIVFVGIFTMVSQIAMRMAVRSSFYDMNRNKKDKNGGTAAVMLLIMILSLIGYFFSTILRLSISRKREYMADAGAAQMTKQPLALASALRKISGNSSLSNVEREDIAQLFIEHPINKKSFSSLFATHPPIEKRIEILEQF